MLSLQLATFTTHSDAAADLNVSNLALGAHVVKVRTTIKPVQCVMTMPESTSSMDTDKSTWYSDQGELKTHFARA